LWKRRGVGSVVTGNQIPKQEGRGQPNGEAVVSTHEEELYEGLGIIDVGPGMKEGRSYAVSFTLFVDAATPHEAFERAMQFRNAIGTGDPAEVRTFPFSWHLHDVENR
jgi:hypothetical protein